MDTTEPIREASDKTKRPKNLEKRGSTWYLVFDFKGKRFLRSLYTDRKDIAASRAKVMKRTIIDQELGLIPKPPEKPKEIPTIGEIIKIYNDRGPGVVGQMATVLANIAKLRLVLREGLHKATNDEVDRLPLTILTKDLRQTWIEQRQAGALKDGGTVGSANSTINANLRGAAGLFSCYAMPLYRGLHIPDVTGFTRGKKLKELSHRFTGIQDSVWKQIKEDADSLSTKNPALYKVWELMLRLGMRNIEALNARWSWIEEHDGVRVMAIRNRPEWSPKQGHEREITMPRDVLVEWQDRNPQDFIVPGEIPTDRHDLIYRDMSLWIRKWMPDTSKSSYNLRKMFGSLVADRFGLGVAQDQLGHRYASTTEDHYKGRLNRAPALEADQI